jgi:hypothetical protein
MFKRKMRMVSGENSRFGRGRPPETTAWDARAGAISGSWWVSLTIRSLIAAIYPVSL